MLEIWSIRPDGTHLRQLTDLPQNGKRLVTWSPDGRYIAYTQDSVVNGQQHVSVWVARVDASGARDAYELTTGKCPSDSGNPCRNLDAEGNFINFATDAGVPTWSPKGDKIAFWSGIENQRGQIWVIDPDGNNRTQLTFPDKPPAACTMYPNNDDPRWAPDGEKILFSTTRSIVIFPGPSGPVCGEPPELWQMSADGSKQEFITNNTFSPFPGNAAYQPVP
jgi:Tol biopolymer transport system component